MHCEQAEGQDAQMGEPDDILDESAAGPEARAAANQAIQAYERARGHSPQDLLGGQSVNDVVEAMMQQAFPDDQVCWHTQLSSSVNCLSVLACIQFTSCRELLWVST